MRSPRRFPIEVFTVVVALVMLVAGWFIYGSGEMGRFGPVVHAQKAPSQLYASMLIRYAKGPIYEELYRMTDIEGVSTFQYRVRGFNGRQVTVSQPPARMYDVSFFVGRLDQDGVWQLIDRPSLANADAHYTVYVRQLADYREGQRTVTFTDPRYWATTQEFSIDLSKGVPHDLLHMRSARVADTRYEQIVKDFRDFGPDEFRHNVATAQARVAGVPTL